MSGGSGAVAVIAVQPRADDALGNCLAACTAGGMRLVLIGDGEIGVGGNGKPAVETGGFGHGVVCRCLGLAVPCRTEAA